MRGDTSRGWLHSIRGTTVFVKVFRTLIVLLRMASLYARGSKTSQEVLFELPTAEQTSQAVGILTNFPSYKTVLH